MAKQPNILYIMTDQQSVNAMSCAGNEYLSTPAFDALAAEGTRFERAYCTYPLCTPSRASMIAGRWPHEVGITGNGQPIDAAYRNQELGHLLSQAGYRCAYGGKWHIPEIAVPWGHGFESICGFDDVALPERCRDFFERDHDRPFFLVASFDNPHNICEWRRRQNVPWGSVGRPPRVEDCPTLPANFAIPPFEPEAVRIISRSNPRIYPDDRYTPEQWRRYRWGYNRLVEKVDAQIGRVLQSLEAVGLHEDTVVIVSSDHGDAQGAHHLVQKTFLYDEATHVPLIIRAPGEPQGQVDRHLVSNGLDIYATICDFAGIIPPEGTHGRSLRPLVGGETPDWREYVAAETYRERHRCDGRMICTDRYKYTAYSWGAYREQLIDLEADPGEMVNLAVASKYEDILQHHRDLLRDWCERTGDAFYGHHYSHPSVPFMVPGDEYPQST